MIDIKKGTIVKNFLEEHDTYSIMFIGQVVEIEDGIINLSPCIFGYKIKHQDTYTIFRIDSTDTVCEELSDAGLAPVGPEEYDTYLHMLSRRPITIEEFGNRLTKALEEYKEQEQQPAEEEYE